jgi:hypothetical protein
MGHVRTVGFFQHAITMEELCGKIKGAGIAQRFDHADKTQAFETCATESLAADGRIYWSDSHK